MCDTMTKLEALDYMRKNPYAKVAHRLFDKNEYLYMKPDGKIYTEEDYLFEDFYSLYRADGMRIRTSKEWRDGWYEYHKSRVIME